MATRRRLLVAPLMLVSVLLVFALRLSLETSWSLRPISSSSAHNVQSEPSRKPTSSISEDVPRPSLSPATTTTTTTTTTRPQGQDGRQEAAFRSTESPFIGDIYATAEVPERTVCSESLHLHLKKTEFLGIFLDRIPVLQTRKDATEEEYERLSRYAGANGWANIRYQALVESLSVLNSSSNWLLLDDWATRRNQSDGRKSASDQSGCSRCAVVGNGGILRNSRKGKEIDAHDYVFRTNGAVIGGYQEDVGSRTTHYVFSTNTLINSIRSYAAEGYRGPPRSPETRYVFLPDHDRDYLLLGAAARHVAVATGPDRGRHPGTLFGDDVSSRKLKMFHPDFIRYVRNRFLRSKTLKTKYKDIYRPSTGATMLLAAVQSCDQVSAYGFMTPDFRRYSDHYYDAHFHPVGFFINHDLHLEMLLWQRLHRAGLLRLYMGNDASNRK